MEHYFFDSADNGSKDSSEAIQIWPQAWKPALYLQSFVQKFEVDVIFAILLQSAAIPFIACPKKPSHRPLASGQGGTVDQSEASKFDYGASGWWEPGVRLISCEP